jgi:uncharacterized membrane protein
MTLSQSAAISADSVTIACSLVAFAMLLRVREVPITNAFLSALLIVFAVWGLCKTSLWALPLVLLVPPSLFTSRRRWLGYLVGVAVAMIAAVALWQLVAAADMRAFAALRRQGGIHTSASLFWLLSHPLHFGWWMIRVIHAHYPAYLHQFVGGFGWMWIGLRLRYQIPALVVLALSILAVHSGKPFSTRERILLLAVFIGALSFIHAILFVTDGSPPPSAPASFQGRYIIPFSLAGLLAFVPDKPVIPVRIGAVVVVLSGVIYGLSSLILIASSYYL